MIQPLTTPPVLYSPARKDGEKGAYIIRSVSYHKLMQEDIYHLPGPRAGTGSFRIDLWDRIFYLLLDWLS